MTGEIPFYNLFFQHQQIKEEVLRAMQQVFDSGSFVLGENVERFEQEYARYIGVKHCIGVGNGLDALTLSLRVLGIGAGDEVLVPANTYIATVLAVTSVGAKPILVEPDLNSYNIDPVKLEEKISSKTKAIIPVHLYGLACEMKVIQEIAVRYDLYVIEDNAQATGSLYEGKKTGSFGHLNAHSFYPTKNLGALGDGGAITTDNDELARKVRLYRNYGSAVKYHNELQGYNSRLDELQAAVLKVKLHHLEGWLLEKTRLAKRYTEQLSGIKELHLPLLPIEAGSRHSQHLYVVRSEQREALSIQLKTQGISTLIHYPIPVYRQQAYAGQFDVMTHALTDRLAAEVLSLPIYPGMTNSQVDKISEVLRKSFL